MNYEEARRIVDAVECQKRVAFYHGEIEILRNVIRDFPAQRKIYETNLLHHMELSRRESKRARVMLGIENE